MLQLLVRRLSVLRSADSGHQHRGRDSRTGSRDQRGYRPLHEGTGWADMQWELENIIDKDRMNSKIVIFKNARLMNDMHRQYCV